jgi:hypothetical protein
MALTGRLRAPYPNELVQRAHREYLVGVPRFVSGLIELPDGADASNTLAPRPPVTLSGTGPLRSRRSWDPRSPAVTLERSFFDKT